MKKTIALLALAGLLAAPLTLLGGCNTCLLYTSRCV